MSDGQTCYERDEVLCEDQMCLRTGCRIRNERLGDNMTAPSPVTDEAERLALVERLGTLAARQADIGNGTGYLAATLRETMAFITEQAKQIAEFSRQPPPVSDDALLQDLERVRGAFAQEVTDHGLTKARAEADRDRLASENVALREALEPFAKMAPHVERTDKRDGAVVHRQTIVENGEWRGYAELTKQDFRRAALRSRSGEDNG